MPMPHADRHPRARASSIAALAIVAAILLATALPSDAIFPRGGIGTSTVQDDYVAARNRLASMLVTIQDVEGLVPQASVLTVVTGLNQALDKLELASIALGSGLTSQASANISAANTIMNDIEAPIAELVAQANSAKILNVLAIAAGAGATCVAVAAAIWLKRRHDKKQLQSFLAAEIDYAADDKTSEGNVGQDGSLETRDAQSNP